MPRFVIGVLSVLALTISLPSGAADPDTQVPQASTKPSVPLCFAASKICIARKSSSGELQLQDLQLTQHDLTWMMSELAELSPQILVESEYSDAVEVIAPPVSEQIPFGLGSLVWAMRNPTQSWRILLPAQ